MHKIDQERRYKGIKQQVLCSQIGISTKTYAALLRGDCNRLDVFLRIVEIVYASSEVVLLPNGSNVSTNRTNHNL